MKICGCVMLVIDSILSVFGMMLCELFEREEIMVMQRSRVDCLHEGDRNTRFFYPRATVQKCTNKIHCLARDDGSLCNSQVAIKGMVRKF